MTIKVINSSRGLNIEGARIVVGSNGEWRLATNCHDGTCGISHKVALQPGDHIYLDCTSTYMLMGLVTKLSCIGEHFKEVVAI